MFKLNKGIVLEQRKEPALSKEFKEFFSSKDYASYIDEQKTDRDVEKLSVAEVLDICKKANIVDESDGKSLYEKLLKAKDGIVTTVVADAIDDEPYISSQINAALNLPNEFTMGLKLAKMVSGANEEYIAVYKNIGELKTKIPHRINEIEVKHIHGKYPAQYTAKMSLNLKGQLVVGACALVHLYRACRYGRIQSTTFVTVAGSCVSNPTNLEVSLGMSVTQVLERCGLIYTPARVVIGGSMTGIGVIDTDNTVITPVTRGVLAYKEQFKKYNFNCIGCGKCVSSCPMELSPNYIYRHICKNQKTRLKLYDVEHCIGCGICSYICPAKLNLSDTIYEYALESKVNRKKTQKKRK